MKSYEKTKWITFGVNIESTEFIIIIHTLWKLDIQAYVIMTTLQNYVAKLTLLQSIATMTKRISIYWEITEW